MSSSSPYLVTSNEILWREWRRVQQHTLLITKWVGPVDCNLLSPWSWGVSSFLSSSLCCCLVVSRVAPKSDFDRIPKTEDLRSWKISEYRRPKIFVLKKFPNTEDRRSLFMKNFRIPKTEDLRSSKISEYRRPKIFVHEKFPKTKDRRSSQMKNFRIPKTKYLPSWKISE